MIRGGVGEQLKMFMTPAELKSYAKPYDKAEIETADSMWKRKERESREEQHWSNHGGGVFDSVAREGVTSHVSVIHDASDGPGLADGHHRVAAAAAAERETGRQQFIPIDHTDPDDAYDSLLSYDERYPQNVRKGWEGG